MLHTKLKITNNSKDLNIAKCKHESQSKTRVVLFKKNNLGIVKSIYSDTKPRNQKLKVSMKKSKGNNRRENNI